MVTVRKIKEKIKGVIAVACLVLCPFPAFAACEAGDNVFLQAYCTLTDVGASLVDRYKDVVDFMLGLCPSTLKVLEDHLSNCWVCALFYKIFDAINMLSTAVYNQIHDGSITLMAYLLLFWLVIRIGRMFVSFQPPDPMDFWNQTGRVLFRAVFATALLIQPAGVVGYWIVSPVIEGAVDFNQAILKSYSGVASFGSKVSEVKAVQINEQVADDEYISETEKYEKSLEEMNRSRTAEDLNNLTSCGIGEMTEGEAAADGNMFNAQIRSALECMVQGLYKEVAFGLAMASSMVCNSWTANTYLIIRYPSIGLLLAGIALWLTCFFILLIFTFKIIDATFRLGVVGTILPLLIVAWVFPQSTEYAKTGFKILVRVILTYIMIAIIMALVIIMMLQAFQGPDGGENLRQLFLDNNVRAMSKEIEFPALNFLMALFCCLLAVTIMKTVDKIASEYAGVDFGADAASKVGAMAMQGAANVAQSSVSLAKAAVAKMNGGRSGGKGGGGSGGKGGGGSKGDDGNPHKTTPSAPAVPKRSFTPPASPAFTNTGSGQGGTGMGLVQRKHMGHPNHTAPAGASAAVGNTNTPNKVANPQAPKTGQGGTAMGLGNRNLNTNRAAPKTMPKSGQGGMGMGFKRNK